MTPKEISNLRLNNQQLINSKFKTAKDVVSYMGAMQAQDFEMVKWAVGIRFPNSRIQMIESAINKGEVIRTHLMRPTWHLVSVNDVYWLLELTASKIKSSMKSRDRQLELSEAIYKKSNRILEKALLGRKCLTREEIKTKFEKNKIDTDNNRLWHILINAELDKIICSGPIKKNKQTYALLDERVSNKRNFTRDEALAELATRYFTSHCPATIKDFSWWSGLSVKDANNSLEMVKSNFISETINSKIYWFTNSISKAKNVEDTVHLLPAYDEFLISYKDRSAALPQRLNNKAVSSNGIFYPTLLLNGQIIGLWKRTTTKDKVVISINPFKQNNKKTNVFISEAADRFHHFLGKQIEIIEKSS